MKTYVLALSFALNISRNDWNRSRIKGIFTAVASQFTTQNEIEGMKSFLTKSSVNGAQGIIDRVVEEFNTKQKWLQNNLPKISVFFDR